MPPVLAPRSCPLRADPSPDGPGLTLRLPGGSPWGTQPLHSRRWPGSPAQPWKERAWSPQPVPRFPLQAAVSVSGRAWPGQSCSCCLPASSRGTACCRRPASAPPPWTPRPHQPSPCGRRPRPCALCPGPRDADRGRSGLCWDKLPGLPLPSPRLPAWGALWMIEAGRMDRRPLIAPSLGSFLWPPQAVYPRLGSLIWVPSGSTGPDPVLLKALGLFQAPHLVLWDLFLLSPPGATRAPVLSWAPSPPLILSLLPLPTDPPRCPPCPTGAESPPHTPRHLPQAPCHFLSPSPLHTASHLVPTRASVGQAPPTRHRGVPTCSWGAGDGRWRRSPTGQPQASVPSRLALHHVRPGIDRAP